MPREFSLEALVTVALDAQATDIHLFCQSQSGSVRYRINGELSDHTLIPSAQFKPLIASIKLRSGMDIAVSNRPQDGLLSIEPLIDLRIATLPTVNGEDCAIRISDRRGGIRTIAELGINAALTDELMTLAGLTQGLVLVTGATGSGKTTTLYSVIDHILATSKRSIVTLEDPVEFPIDGIRQSPIRQNGDYTFADGIRAILRQDPDVIMVGEIRDRDTAVAAVEAAYTGHLVLSTLHTSSIAATIQRLNHFNLDPFWIAQSIQGIMSQRLVTTPCICKIGCEKCRFTGVSGRRLQAELVSLRTSTHRNALMTGTIPDDGRYLTS